MLFILDLHNNTFSQIWDEDYLNKDNTIKTINRCEQFNLPSIKSNRRHEIISDFMYMKRDAKRTSLLGGKTDKFIYIPKFTPY